LIGDTIESDPLLQDEEINFSLTVESSLNGAAALCCEAIAKKFAREADRGLGPMRIAASQKSTKYDAMAKDLRKKAAGYGTPYSGNMSVSDRDTDKSDTTLNQPAFTRDMMSNLDASEYDDE
jgi:hypothetical protein